MAKNYVPYQARLILRRFEPAIRDLMASMLQECGEQEGGTTMPMLQECISRVMTKLTDIESSIVPDPTMVEASTKAYRDGDAMTTQEWVNELRQNRRLAKAGA